MLLAPNPHPVEVFRGSLVVAFIQEADDSRSMGPSRFSISSSYQTNGTQ